MTHNFFQNIYESLNKHEQQNLIVWPSEQQDASTAYTGADLKAQITAFRDTFTTNGVQAGDKVLLAAPFRFSFICALLAVLATGAIPVLPPAKASKAALFKLLFSSDIKAMVTASKTPFSLKFLAKLLSLKLLPLQAATTTETKWEEPVAVPPEQPALISHSSGSTGMSKAITRSHSVLQAQHQVLKGIFPPWAEQQDFPLFPNILLHNLSIGTTSILPDLPWSDLTQLSPEPLVQQIITNKVDTMTGNLFYFQRLYTYLKEHNILLPQVKAIGIGGSPITENLVHALKKFFPEATVYIIYGSSEAEPIAVRAVGKEVQNPALGYAVGGIHPTLEYKLEAIGEVILHDGTAYAVGEIKVRGPHVAVTEKNAWLSTGDFGYLDKRNHLYLTGRRGNEKLRNGVQHYQIEHVLQHQEGITRAAARATEKGFDLYIEGKTSEIDVRELLQQHFPADIIHNIKFRQRLPVDARHFSKILYSKLA